MLNPKEDAFEEHTVSFFSQTDFLSVTLSFLNGQKRKEKKNLKIPVASKL